MTSHFARVVRRGRWWAASIVGLVIALVVGSGCLDQQTEHGNPPPTNSTATTQPTRTTRPPTTEGPPTTTVVAQRLRVVGNQLRDVNGAVVHLHGVNYAGTEYACIQGWGIFDGPNNDATVAAMAAWHINIVRIPLNEDCWLDINGVKPEYAGANYVNAIRDFVNLLHKHGMYAELSLMWAAPAAYPATYQSGAPDADHSPAMWAAMAKTFADDPNVILAPWGETITGWSCFMKTGCNDEATFGPKNEGYQTAPMQQAVTVMRGSGYHGPIAIPCIAYANACGVLADGSEYNGSTWLKSRPADPDGQLVAEAHVYGQNLCSSIACFESSMAPIAREVPLIWGETGENYTSTDCGSRIISQFLAWADAHGVGYEAWTWNTWNNCASLIANFDGTPGNDYAKWIRSFYIHK